MDRDGTGASARPGIALWLAVLLGGLGIVFLAVAAPALRFPHPRLSALIYAVFSPLCHQIPERCFYFRGFPVAVCGRCLGIYSGFVAGTLFHPILQGFARPRLPAVRALAALSIPIGVDVAGNVLHAWSSPTGIRFVTGIIWGVILPFFVLPGIHDLALTGRHRRRAKWNDPPGDPVPEPGGEKSSSNPALIRNTIREAGGVKI
jgi:uncharacterized membrane protein